MCLSHYRFQRKYGDPNPRQKQHHGLTVRERFDAYVKKQPGCWDWTAQKDRNGYCFLHVDGKPMLVHRLSYILHYGDIPVGMNVLHKCDNPSCVNPEHLFLGDQAANVQDMHAKGRARKRGLKGSEHHRAKLTEDDVRAIRNEVGIDREIAAKYGISRTQAHDIRKRRSWAHVTDT